MLRLLLPVVFVLAFCYGGVITTWYYFAKTVYHWEDSLIYASLAVVGVSAALIQGILMRSPAFLLVLVELSAFASSVLFFFLHEGALFFSLHFSACACMSTTHLSMCHFSS